MHTANQSEKYSTGIKYFKIVILPKELTEYSLHQVFLIGADL